MKKASKKITYLDTYCGGGYKYEDYVESCEINGIEPKEEDSTDYWEWIGERTAQDAEDFFENLKYAKGNVQNPCVISGELGLWHSTPTIQPTMADNLASAVSKCWGSCDDVEVVLEDGVVYVKAMHHDGTNYFEIRPLTARGEEKMRMGEDICIGNHWHTEKYPEYLY